MRLEWRHQAKCRESDSTLSTSFPLEQDACPSPCWPACLASCDSAATRFFRRSITSGVPLFLPCDRPFKQKHPGAKKVVRVAYGRLPQYSIPGGTEYWACGRTNYWVRRKSCGEAARRPGIAPWSVKHGGYCKASQTRAAVTREVSQRRAGVGAFDFAGRAAPRGVTGLGGGLRGEKHQASEASQSCPTGCPRAATHARAKRGTACCSVLQGHARLASSGARAREKGRAWGPAERVRGLRSTCKGG
mmetsp:Transcript_5164/g.15677  ORF Transcript_5164/g.15677 Transcript_5164/m.15677 type:complete len:246 (-) Transcript_5164:1190-1927(-)